MSTRTFVAVACAGLLVLGAGCSRAKQPATPPPTFTPAATASGVPRVRATPAHPVVSRDCLRGLSSYRFAGSFSLLAPTPAAAASPPGGETSGLAGSIANLLSDVSFEGAALAPDRYQARVTFGGNGVAPLDIARIGPQTYSRFGNGAWQQGDQIQGFGGLGQFDPQSLCQNILTSLDAGTQPPARETVNGISSLRYEIAGPQLARAFGAQRTGATPASATAAPRPAVGQATIWEAERGGYPVRFQITTSTSSGAASLLVNVSDVNARDIQINPPG